MSKLLINENPLQVLPSLAESIGLNEAIVLQQVHYWLENNKINKKNFHDGYVWTYNTYEEWAEQFKFWSLSTLKRVFKSLEKQELLLIGNYNKMKVDRTKWYTINYHKLDQIESEKLGNSPLGQNDTMQSVKMNRPSCQNEPLQEVKMNQCHSVKMTSPIPETTEIISETSTDIYSIFDFWNEKEIINHEEITDKLQKKIKSVLKNYSVDEVKEAIENYSTIIKDQSYFFNYKWTLLDFLTRKKGISEFFKNGGKWINYINNKDNASNNNNTRPKTKEDEYYDKVCAKLPF